jgi:hypothetical protein
MVDASKCVRKGQRACASAIYTRLRTTISALSAPVNPNIVLLLDNIVSKCEVVILKDITR